MSKRTRASTEQILDLTESIYAAALVPERWTGALAAIQAAVGGAATALRVESRPSGAVRQTWIGFEPAFQKAYAEHYWREDVCASTWPVGNAAVADVLVPAEVRRRNAFFHELCVPHQLDDIVGGHVESSAEGMVTLSVMKHRGTRPFDTTHAELLDGLLPHVRRAVRINAAIGTAERDKNLAWEMIDRLPVAVFALDGDGRVRHMNRAAERTLGNGLRIASDGLRAGLPHATHALRKCLAAARAPAKRAGPIAVALPRPGGPPLSAVAIPAAREDTLGLGSTRPSILLVVTDPLTQVEGTAAVLMGVFQLTAAEARVAILVGRGLAPKEAAAQLGTSWNTVRFQLRQVYGKTQTSGQSALARLLVLLSMSGAGPHT